MGFLLLVIAPLQPEVPTMAHTAWPCHPGVPNLWDGQNMQPFRWVAVAAGCSRRRVCTSSERRPVQQQLLQAGGIIQTSKRTRNP